MRLLILSLFIISFSENLNIINSFSTNQDKEVSLNQYSYEKLGRDWPGLCLTGTRQSPINIIEGINTEEEKGSFLEFNYHLERDFADNFEKIKFNGKGLSILADIGGMVFNHQDGTKEYFKSEKIVFHYPAEHSVTMNGQTPRYPLEIQIVHSLTKTTNVEKTNNKVKVKKAIISFLFKSSSILPEGDQFLNRLGFDGRQLRPDGTAKTVEPGQFIDLTESQRGSLETGFDVTALNALRNIINFDHHVFRYYGSETEPPCNEHAEWFVFAQPRAASKSQISQFRDQLMKIRLNPTGNENINVEASKFYGNNRALQIYDDAVNDKIYSMKNGISQIEGLAFPKI